MTEAKTPDSASKGKQRRRKSGGGGAPSASESPTRVSLPATLSEARFVVTLSLPVSSSGAQEPNSAVACSGGAQACLFNTHSMSVLGIGFGDLVLISADRGEGCATNTSAAATAWPSSFVQRGFVEIDEQTCSNSSASAGSSVRVSLAKDPPRVLREITVEPPIGFVAPKKPRQPDLPDFVSASLQSKLICIGNSFPVRIYGSVVQFRVASTLPEPREAASVFLMSPQTEVTISGLGEEAGRAMAEEPEVDSAERSRVSLDDVAGMPDVIAMLKEVVALPLRSPETFERYGIKPPRGVLLCGPSGVGKSLLAHAIAGFAGASLFTIAGSEALSRFVGESEAKLRSVFSKASESSPSVIIIDEIDALCPSRDETQSEVDKRVVSTLLTLMDGIATDAAHRVSVVATTSRPNVLDPALRRAGRFDKEIEIGAPPRPAREAIFRLHLNRLKHELTPEQISQVAASAHGFVGADLAALARNSALRAFRRASRACTGPIEERALGQLSVTFPDVLAALAEARPSAMREVAIDVPQVRWEDVGGHADVKKKLQEAIEWPVRHPEVFDAMGISPPCGVLLFGPPGCSKTLMAQALATETGLNFIAVKGPQLLSKFVGDSERAVRDVFKRARQNAPCILFFDEIDGLVGRERDAGSEGGASRVLSQLLTEMDGISPLRNVAVVAATNRPDLIDPALLRPGRIDRALFLGLPDASARLEIMKIHTRKVPHDPQYLEALVARTEGFSGAELSSLCSTASLLALRESIDATKVEKRHWDAALTIRGPPAIGRASLESYDQFAFSSELATL